MNILEILGSNFYEICQNNENLQVKKFNIKFSINPHTSNIDNNSSYEVFRSLKDMPPFSPSTVKYPRLTNNIRSESFFILSGAMNVLILQCCVFFFFVSVFTRTCGNNASISNFGGVVSDSKMNLIDTLGRSPFEFPKSFQKPKKN
ncbi:Uncharacterized protein FWK35_00023516 [Aphis craccivora]|uniref:Uncharacterized protein n=1 Tax=Aphis craccivora TaxID=307492 RepID=A0A6G0YJS5_APHCR|nr:Uncharacterized protein FWK35_00023516 [Aphis craccivora]